MQTARSKCARGTPEGAARNLMCLGVRLIARTWLEWIQKGLGNYKKAEEIEEKIQVLIKTDTRSKEMFAKYGELLLESEEKLVAVA